MPLITTWTKVGVAVQTVLAAALTISAISKASTAVATITANGLANGDIGFLQVNGMTELNNAVVRVAGAATNTINLEGVDSTNFGTFTSGTFQKITFGAACSTLTDVNASGGEAAPTDITTIHDDTSKELPGVKSALSYSFGSLWDPSDAALIELKKGDDTKSQRCIAFTFANGTKAYCAGYVTAPLVPTGSSGGPVTTPVSLRVQGRVTAYAS